MASPVPTVKSNLQHAIVHRLRPKYKWEVIQEFGQMGGGLNGGIAKVRTKDDSLGRDFIEKRFSQEDIYYKAAHKEISMLHQVGDHAHITKMYDYFVDEQANKSSVYMEFCNMGSLQDVAVKLQKGQRLNEHKLWLWFIQSVEALTYCHRGHEPDNPKAVANWSRIYHRDIKPANILLTLIEKKGRKRLVAKLADFGGAQSDEWTWQTKSQADASRTSTTTPGFDPPEFPKYSGASDVWQMALVFVCLSGLAGQPPKSTHNPEGKQWNIDQPAGPNYSHELSSTLKWCLKGDYKVRPGAYEVLKRAQGAYALAKRKLPDDPQPLEIFSQAGAPSPPAPTSGGYTPQAAQPQQQPGPAQVPNNYVEQVAGQRKNQGYVPPYPHQGGNPWGRRW